MIHTKWPRTLFLLCLFIFPACSPDTDTPAPTVATVNNYNISLSDFERMLAEEIEYEEQFKLTNEVKKKFIEESIRKELLIQEAKKLELDRKEKFIKTIEKYWESTLIRDLIHQKSNELNKRISVSEEEIAAFYQQNPDKQSTTPPPPEEYDRIKKSIREKKKSAALKSWIDNLRQQADVTINEDLLYN